MVRIRSAGHPEQATTSAFVEIADKSRAMEPNSPVRSVVGSLLRQAMTLQRY